jgi:hypothetical protein
LGSSLKELIPNKDPRIPWTFSSKVGEDLDFIPSFNTLVFWARSEIFGYADGGRYLNPKHKIRNPKQYRMI